MKPMVMMIKARVPSEDEMKDRFENPGNGTYDCSKNSNDHADEATDQANDKSK